MRKRIIALVLLVVMCLSGGVVYADDATTEATTESSNPSGGSTSGSDGSWVKVHIQQSSNFYKSHCTFFTFVHMVQNSGQCKSDVQIDAGNYLCSMDETNKAKLEKFHGDMWSGGLVFAYVTGMNNYSESKWSKPDFSQDGYSTGSASGGNGIVITQFGGKEINDLFKSDHDKFMQVCQFLWNQGYWMYVGVDGSGGSGIGPDGYAAGHTIMVSGVTDSGVCLCDSATGEMVTSLEGTYSNCYWIGIIKNEKTSLKDAAGGGGFTGGDGNGSNDLGIAPTEFMGFDEANLSSYCRLNEIDLSEILDGATEENLNNNELVSLEDWQMMSEKDSDFIIWARRIIMILGIIITVWGILFYCAFWFDRINTYFDLDFVGILSFGKLRRSDTDEECTFKLTDQPKSEARTINHKYCLIISVSAIAFGVLLISGVLFLLVRKIVNFVQSIF